MRMHAFPLRSVVVLLALACSRPGGSVADTPASDAEVVEWVYRGGLQPRWLDFGYAPHGPSKTGPQAIDLSGYSGWILATRSGDWAKLGDLVFRYQAPAKAGDWLDVKLDDGGGTDFPVLVVTAARRSERDGWTQARLPMAELNPSGLPFDRFRFKARRALPRGWVEFDGIGFTAKVAAPPPPPAPVVPVSLAVDCRAPGHAISPWIYGIASSHRLDAPYAELGATAGRWGGNTSSRYNWELGQAWNAGSDWYFRNTNYSGREDFSWRDELAFNRAQGVPTAFTVSMLGWVAKDTRSFSFPVASFGAQESADGQAGNGLLPGGRKLRPGPPTATSVASSPASIGRWVAAIRGEEAARGGPGALLYFLDNEPGLWNDTHRDVHPQPLTYDELLEKTVATATAVRQAAPDALIAGPSEWGWTGYFWSAADVEAGVQRAPDRRAHGGVPLLPWYLARLAEHQQKTGVRLLDVLDVHFYPQGRGLGLGEQGGTDEATAARRLRSTRALWDPSYVDESWIAEPVELIPRLKRWSAEQLPGLKISIGEYNWGAERHWSGGLALAEVLGRFGEQGVFSAFYWRVPAKGSAAWHAFRAFGNYDGQGARFPAWHVPTRMAQGVSLFAARDAERKRLVLIALNLEPKRGAQATIELAGCGALAPARTFVSLGSAEGLVARPAASVTPGGLTQELPPSSITVLELMAAQDRAP